MLSAPRRKENDLAIGQVPAVEIVVFPLRKTPQSRSVEFHFIQVIESIFGDFRFVQLVDDSMDVWVVLAVSEQHLSSVVRKLGPDDVAQREIFCQRAKHRLFALEVFQYVHPATRSREPAVVLVAHVRIGARPGRDGEPSRRAFDKQQIVAVQKRIGKSHFPHCPTCAKVQVPFHFRRQVLRLRTCLLGDLVQRLQFAFNGRA